VITCPKCSKDNQDHYKFCLGCGAELPRDAAPKKFPGGGTPPQGLAAVRPLVVDKEKESPQGAASTARSAASPGPAASGAAVAPAAPAAVLPPVAAAAAAPAGGAAVVCGDCSHVNAVTNRFCASCGAKLAKPAAAPPSAAAAAPAAPAAASTSVLMTALRADGSEAGSYNLPSAPTTLIGRDTGAIFAGDSYLSPRHATFTMKSGKLSVRDESSLNGIYRKLRRDDPIVLLFGDVFRIGQEIMRIETLTTVPATADGVERLGSPSKGYVARLALITGRDTAGNTFPIPEAGLHLGRERGDILFPEDGYVSGLHCRLAWEKTHIVLTDLGSSNGTFVRLNNETELVDNDVLLMGQQLFRINIRS
jgi:pSer/pThr/pTyr-binding forkhead associated (FHA) protein